MQPVCYDLYCGLGGWAEGFLSENYEVIGYDIEAHDYGTGGYPGKLIIRDVRSIHGSELKDAAVIVASPPCTEPSYRAMPWKKAKALNAIGPPHLFIELFNSCFRIQREASEAAGRHIPLIVENVVGAQRWVGGARWHFGSFYLWGDVPALMPIPKKDWKNIGGSWYAQAHNTTSGHSKNPVTNPEFSKSNAGTHLTLTGPGRPRFIREDVKQSGLGGLRKNGKGDGWFQDGAASYGSKSSARKRSSALIAKIPFPLASHIAKCFKPQQKFSEGAA